MDQETEELLNKNNLSEYISVFKHNRIGVNEIAYITPEILRELIEPLGDRWRFLRAVKKFQRPSDKDTSPESSACDNSQSDETPKASRSTLSDVSSNASGQIVPTNEKSRQTQKLVARDETDEESDCVLSDDEIEGEENKRPRSPLNSTASNQSTRQPSGNFDQNRPSTSGSSSSSSKIQLIRNIVKSADDLKEYLQSCVDGRRVLKIFESQKKLTDFARTTLTAIVLDKLLLDHNNLLRNKNFDTAASWICEIFPSESPLTFYIAPFTEGQKQSISKGKLPYRYRNRRSKLAKFGLVSPKKTKSRAEETANRRDQLIAEDVFIEAKTWLAHYSEPWTLVLKKWTETAPNRLKAIETSHTTTVEDILQEWPTLKHPLGYTLVSVDFACAYPEKLGKLLNGWCASRDKILEVMVSRPKKDKQAALHSARSLQHDAIDACKDVTILFLLPALLPATIIRSGKKLWKPTIAESQEAFIIHAKTAEDTELLLAEREKKYEKLGQPIQPCVVIVGSSLEHIDSSYVVAENVRWRLNNPLAAVDVCFKLFHVLNMAYPPAAVNPWMFLQRYFYEIKTKFDKVSCTVTALISEL